MRKKTPLRRSDLRGYARLTVDAIGGLTDLVEEMHHNIESLAGIFGTPKEPRTSGITGLVYGGIRAVTGLVGTGLDAVLGELAPMLADAPASSLEGAPAPGSLSSPISPISPISLISKERESTVAALNGVLGDYLAESRNPLAITMCFRREGRPLALEKQALAAALPDARGKLLVLIHGSSTNDLQWQRKGSDYGAALAADLGYSPVYLHYNSGLHISQNGRALADLLESLVEQWPVPLTEIAILGHSMGGLVARSAFHYGSAAGRRWTGLLRRLVFLGTPHHGAPLERTGNWVDILLAVTPYTAPFTRLGKIRSAGVTDLRYAYLVDEDWEGRDRFARSGVHRRALPLPEGVECYAVAGTVGSKRGDLGDLVVGDGLVPTGSALGRHKNPKRDLAIPPSHQLIAYNTGHLDLLSSPVVYEQLKTWLGPSAASQ